jgi:hypothetical protein
MQSTSVGQSSVNHPSTTLGREPCLTHPRLRFIGSSDFTQRVVLDRPPTDDAGNTTQGATRREGVQEEGEEEGQ